ncbi:hypothetical protein DL96DRAFT_1605477 [Flagelloscypha sp. PMI_526]|nr:hypothetical protein DL96DRAFT_1605477 [Flagelloscypha sp. PMI_526]
MDLGHRNLTLRLLPTELHPESFAALLLVSHCLKCKTVYVRANLSEWISGDAPSLIMSNSGLVVAAGLFEVIQYLQKNESFQFGAENLCPKDKGLQQAVRSLVTRDLGHLLLFQLFSVPSIWETVTFPALANPLEYYGTHQSIQLRHQIRHELEISGFTINDPPEESYEADSNSNLERFAMRPLPKGAMFKSSMFHKFQITFQRAQVLSRARPCLDSIERLLEDSLYFFNSPSPTVLDFVVAAHVGILVGLGANDGLVSINTSPSKLLTESYPNLVSHAVRVIGQVEVG